MIPLRLELTNFLAYRNPAPLDFTGIHVAVLAGENGAGKSSLLDAITWAIWGRARAKTDNELVHQGQSEMRIVFTFALGDQTYRIIRARRVGRGAVSTLELQARGGQGKWKSIGEATIPKTQEKINRLLRLTYDTFVNSAYFMQGKADEFTSKRPNERKQVLADILGLQEWERYEERAKERIQVMERRIAGLDAVLEEIEAELVRRSEYEQELTQAQAQVIEVGERLRQAEAGWAQIDAARQAMIVLERQLDDLTRRIRDGEQELAALDKDLGEARSRADVEALSREVEDIHKRLAELDGLEAERERVTRDRQSTGEQAAELRAQNDAAHAEADALKERLKILQDATEPRCPTCGQLLTEDARAQLVAQLTQEVEDRREKYGKNQRELKVLNERQATLDGDLQRMGNALREKSLLIQRGAERQTALIQAGEARERIPGLLERRQRWAASLEADREQGAKLDEQAGQYESVLRDSADRQRALDQLRQEDTLAKARLGAAQQKLGALESQARQREARRAERQQLAEERGLYDEVKEAFGKKGVPAMMIEAAVPEIEASANDLLARMTGGRMHARFNMQRETQAGDVRETLDIQIADELGTRAYELYSGGESFRVDFAVRVALSHLLARRAGTQLQTLIIDEGFGVLDAQGRERLVEAINAAQADFQRILVVTHIDELKDAFPARIEITKGPNGSEISVM